MAGYQKSYKLIKFVTHCNKMNTQYTNLTVCIHFITVGDQLDEQYRALLPYLNLYSQM